MKNQEVSRQLQKLHALMANAIQQTQDISLQAAWARFFTVLCAGLLENSIREIYGEYIGRVAAPEAANYAISQLARIQNPKSEKFVQTAYAFSKAWGDELDAFIQDNGRKEAIDSILNIRHQVAHGQDAGITYARITEYLNKAVDVLEFIETQVKPP
jgi:hypothetical protein